MENYDAFISYSRHNANIASAVHNGLEKYAKEKNSIRALRIFLDYNSLNVSDDLSDSIKLELNKSNYFILFASPESANSEWVKQELEYFYKLKGSTKNILIVLVSGHILWDKNSNEFNREVTNSISKTDEKFLLKNRFISTSNGWQMSQS